MVDFVVWRVLTGDGDETTASGLDDVTTYYILHRHDFGMNDAPVAACILYAVSCNLSDNDLANRHEILLRTGGLSALEDEDNTGAEAGATEGEEDADAAPEEGTGSVVKLRPWHQRKRKTKGFDAEGRPAPLIDQVHRLVHLWKAGDVIKVDEYLDARGLRRNLTFHQLLQALIEMAGEGRRAGSPGEPQQPPGRTGGGSHPCPHPPRFRNSRRGSLSGAVSRSAFRSKGRVCHEP